MLLKIKSCCLALIVLTGLFMLTACEKFDRSKIAMPKIHFITSDNLHSVICLDSSHSWIFGNYGTIFFSSDGGSTWNRQASGVEVLLGDAAFVSANEGWAVGVAGTVIHTTDSGKTWTKQASNTEKDLFNVFFLDAQNGWAVGEYGTIIHTGDGGKPGRNRSSPKMLSITMFFLLTRRQDGLSVNSAPSCIRPTAAKPGPRRSARTLFRW